MEISHQQLSTMSTTNLTITGDEKMTTRGPAPRGGGGGGGGGGEKKEEERRRKREKERERYDLKQN